MDQRWWLLILEGIVGIGIGIFVFAHPAATAVGLVTVIGIWAIVTGIAEIAAAVRLHRVITGEWFLGISGAVSVLFGLALLAAPSVGLLFGISLLVAAFRLRGYSQKVTI